MPNAGSFADYRIQTLDPRHGAEGVAWSTAIGGEQDAELARARVAALSRLPAYCPDDALDVLGTAFHLPRLPSESNAAYRARQQAVWTTYSQASTPQSVKASLVAYGLVDVYVAELGQPHVFAPETSSADYSEFYVFLGPNLGTTGIVVTVLGSCTLGSCLLGTSATTDQITAIKRQILTWKAAHSYPIKIVFQSSGTSGSPTTATADATYPIGRTLGDTMPPLGDVNCVLGGYQ